ncbi:MAG: metallophosphoesterase family protein [Rikenellaceae bacterium]
MKKIGIISDTHGTFDETLRYFLRDVDEIWHAGDIGTLALADEIAAYKPLRAVWGNIDGADLRRAHHPVEFFECEGAKILMTHIGGYPKKYRPEARELIVKYRPDLFIAGHSHILKVIYDQTHQHLHINPGAAGNYGIHKLRTAVRFQIEDGKFMNMEIGEWSRG